VLSEREQRSLMQIERRLRAEDDRFTRSFETFKVDLAMVFPDPQARPVLDRVVHLGRWTLSVTSLALIPAVWAVVVLSSGDLAAVSRIAALPLTAFLLAVGLAMHPDRPRRSQPLRDVLRSAQGGDGGQPR
jgi:hypothetical protein